MLLANFFWFLLNVPFVFLYFLLLTLKASNFWLVLSGLLMGSIAAATFGGMCYFTDLLVQQKEIKVWEFFQGIKKFGLQSIGYFLFITLIYFVLGANIRYYIGLQGGLKWFGAVLAGLALWIGLFLLFALQYLYPLLVRHNPGFKKLIMRMLLLALDNILVTLLGGMSVFSIIVLTCLTGVGPVFFTAFLFAMFSSNLLHEVLEKYKEKEIPAPAPLPDKPTSWKQIQQQEAKETTAPKWRHEGRGWKDILRPWDV